jgi:glycosyltransferase involved in cell wall biosynthesis
VLAQSAPPADVVVVDDGSTDNTPDVMSSYWFRSHIRYIRTEHRGAAAARNIGWRTVSGDTIAFLDGDDWWFPNKLERQLKTLESQPRLILVYGDTLRVSEDGSAIDRWSEHFHPVRGDALEAMLVKNRVQTSTVLLPRPILEEMGGFNEDLPAWEDIDLWVRVALRYPFAYVPDLLACYRMGSGLSTQLRLMAQGRLATVETVRQHLVSQNRLRRLSDRALADAHTQMGIACYLDGSMGEARLWFRRAWRIDHTAMTRERSFETYAKSLIGAHVIRVLRQRLRASRSARTR